MTKQPPADDRPSSEESPDDEPLAFDELLGWAEFACWTTLALAPFLYWVNGPAVSRDQLVVRSGLVVFAVIGAVGLRARKVYQSRRGSDNNS